MTDFSYLQCPFCKLQIDDVLPLQEGHPVPERNAANVMVCLRCGGPSFINLTNRTILPISQDQLEEMEKLAPEFFIQITNLMQDVVKSRIPNPKRDN